MRTTKRTVAVALFSLWSLAALILGGCGSGSSDESQVPKLFPAACVNGGASYTFGEGVDPSTIVAYVEQCGQSSCVDGVCGGCAPGPWVATTPTVVGDVASVPCPVSTAPVLFEE